MTGPIPPVGTRILVVEDQDDVRLLLTTALEIDGHVVETAANALEGLKRLREGRYDLVLSDYAMPGATGTWMLEEAGRLGLLTHTAAVIVTAHPDVRDFGAVQVITKPLELDKFLVQVRAILAATPRGSEGSTPARSRPAGSRCARAMRRRRARSGT
jgi:two-component system OmpR family response regulator